MHWVAQGLRQARFRWNQVSWQHRILQGKYLTLLVCFLLQVKWEIKNVLTLAAYFLHLETPGLPACYPCKKMHNIISHQGNQYQNHSEIYLTPVRMALIKNKQEVSIGEDVEKMERLCALCCLLVHASISRHLICLHILAVANNTAMNRSIQISFHDLAVNSTACFCLFSITISSLREFIDSSLALSFFPLLSLDHIAPYSTLPSSLHCPHPSAGSRSSVLWPWCLRLRLTVRGNVCLAL